MEPEIVMLKPIKEDIPEDVVIDLDTYKSISDLTEEWKDKIFEKFKYFFDATSHDLSLLLNWYIKSLKEEAFNVLNDEVLKDSVYRHIYIFKLYVLEVGGSFVDVYLDSLEEILAIYCNLEVKLLPKKLANSKKYVYRYKRRISLIIHQLVVLAEQFLLGRKERLFHVFMKMNVDYSEEAKTFFNLLFFKFLTIEPEDKSCLAFCRAYILCQKWKKIRDEEEWPQMDKMVYVAYEQPALSINSNKTLRSILLPNNSDLTTQRNNDPSVLCDAYFQYIRSEVFRDRIEIFESDEDSLPSDSKISIKRKKKMNKSDDSTPSTSASTSVVPAHRTARIEEHSICSNITIGTQMKIEFNKKMVNNLVSPETSNPVGALSSDTSVIGSNSIPRQFTPTYRDISEFQKYIQQSQCNFPSSLSNNNRKDNIIENIKLENYIQNDTLFIRRKEKLNKSADSTPSTSAATSIVPARNEEHSICSNITIGTQTEIECNRDRRQRGQPQPDQNVIFLSDSLKPNNDSHMVNNLVSPETSNPVGAFTSVMGSNSIPRQFTPTYRDITEFQKYIQQSQCNFPSSLSNNNRKDNIIENIKLENYIQNDTLFIRRKEKLNRSADSTPSTSAATSIVPARNEEHSICSNITIGTQTEIECNRDRRQRGQPQPDQNVIFLSDSLKPNNDSHMVNNLVSPETSNPVGAFTSVMGSNSIPSQFTPTYRDITELQKYIQQSQCNLPSSLSNNNRKDNIIENINVINEFDTEDDKFLDLGEIKLEDNYTQNDTLFIRPKEKLNKSDDSTPSTSASIVPARNEEHSICSNITIGTQMEIEFNRDRRQREQPHPGQNVIFLSDSLKANNDSQMFNNLVSPETSNPVGAFTSVMGSNFIPSQFTPTHRDITEPQKYIQQSQCNLPSSLSNNNRKDNIIENINVINEFDTEDDKFLDLGEIKLEDNYIQNDTEIECHRDRRQRGQLHPDQDVIFLSDSSKANNDSQMVNNLVSPETSNPVGVLSSDTSVIESNSIPSQFIPTYRDISELQKYIQQSQCNLPSYLSNNNRKDNIIENINVINEFDTEDDKFLDLGEIKLEDNYIQNDTLSIRRKEKVNKSDDSTPSTSASTSIVPAHRSATIETQSEIECNRDRRQRGQPHPDQNVIFLSDSLKPNNDSQMVNNLVSTEISNPVGAFTSVMGSNSTPSQFTPTYKDITELQKYIQQSHCNHPSSLSNNNRKDNIIENINVINEFDTEDDKFLDLGEIKLEGNYIQNDTEIECNRDSRQRGQLHPDQNVIFQSDSLKANNDSQMVNNFVSPETSNPVGVLSSDTSVIGSNSIPSQFTPTYRDITELEKYIQQSQCNLPSSLSNNNRKYNIIENINVINEFDTEDDKFLDLGEIKLEDNYIQNDTEIECNRDRRQRGQLHPDQNVIFQSDSLKANNDSQMVNNFVSPETSNPVGVLSSDTSVIGSNSIPSQFTPTYRDITELEKYIQHSQCNLPSSLSNNNRKYNIIENINVINEFDTEDDKFLDLGEIKLEDNYIQNDTEIECNRDRRQRGQLHPDQNVIFQSDSLKANNDSQMVNNFVSPETSNPVGVLSSDTSVIGSNSIPSQFTPTYRDITELEKYIQHSQCNLPSSLSNNNRKYNIIENINVINEFDTEDDKFLDLGEIKLEDNYIQNDPSIKEETDLNVTFLNTTSTFAGYDNYSTKMNQDNAVHTEKQTKFDFNYISVPPTKDDINKSYGELTPPSGQDIEENISNLSFYFNPKKIDKKAVQIQTNNFSTAENNCNLVNIIKNYPIENNSTPDASIDSASLSFVTSQLPQSCTDMNNITSDYTSSELDGTSGRSYMNSTEPNKSCKLGKPEINLNEKAVVGDSVSVPIKRKRIAFDETIMNHYPSATVSARTILIPKHPLKRIVKKNSSLSLEAKENNGISQTNIQGTPTSGTIKQWRPSVELCTSSFNNKNVVGLPAAYHQSTSQASKEKNLTPELKKKRGRLPKQTY